MAKTDRGSGRPAKRTAKSGSARSDDEGNGVHRVDLQAEELELLVKACRKYHASLPCYLASAQDEVTRAEALIEKLGDLIEKRAD